MGTCCPSLSSLSMCSSVVFPALSSPRNTSLPDFLYSPRTKEDVVTNQSNWSEFISDTRDAFAPRSKVLQSQYKIQSGQAPLHTLSMPFIHILHVQTTFMLTRDCCTMCTTCSLWDARWERGTQLM